MRINIRLPYFLFLLVLTFDKLGRVLSKSSKKLHQFTFAELETLYPVQGRQLKKIRDRCCKMTQRRGVKAVNTLRGGATDTLSPKPEEEAYSPLVTLRRTIFPIHGKQEVIKFLLIGTIKFFIILALTLTRDTKDTLVVTQCGAEAIAFLKVGHASCHAFMPSLMKFIF
jgi:hypothetical protein